MSKLPAAYAAGYLYAAGWTGQAWIGAVAIAMAESGLDPSAKGGPNKNGSYDWGLMQINDVHKPTDLQKSDAVQNGKLALQIFRARGTFKDWATFNNGNFVKHMPDAKAGVLAWQKMTKPQKDQVLANDALRNQAHKSFAEKVGISNPVSDVSGAIGNGINGLTAGLFKAGANAAAVVTALVLLVLAVVILTKTTPGKAAGVAVKAAML